MPQLEATPTIDYQSETYKDAYSRINAIVIEGEHEAYENFVKLAELLPEHQDKLTALAKMERRHEKGFQACGRNLEVTPDMEFAREFFSKLRDNFQKAGEEGDIVTCLVIQALIIECFAISAYNIYLPVADSFSHKITEGVVKDEYLHLNFGEEWLKARFEEVKPRIEEANRQNLPLVWGMLNQVEDDANVLHMAKEELIEDFTISYGEALGNIGFNTRETVRMLAQGLRQGV
ncbi:MAG: aldehyde oxygenase (deformylating) [Cyanobacteria bacterium SID2]|nr:aldehyde oxygenase (deformylating) [Cyanobacteria bacterium SID2]MBP0003034.1 aldehyde oxygenase (deformylating) [Cyanobacteria bacterium SBC]